MAPKSISSRSRYDHFGNSPIIEASFLWFDYEYLFVVEFALEDINIVHFKNGGESGIRTRGTPLWAYTRFPVVLLRPLGHLSRIKKLEPKQNLNMSATRSGRLLQNFPRCVIGVYGGERGIRTPVGALGPQIDFESIPLRPLR